MTTPVDTASPFCDDVAMIFALPKRHRDFFCKLIRVLGGSETMSPTEAKRFAQVVARRSAELADSVERVLGVQVLRVGARVRHKGECACYDPGKVLDINPSEVLVDWDDVAQGHAASTLVVARPGDVCLTATCTMYDVVKARGDA